MNTNKKDIALIFGAGAVQNAWIPITRAIQPEYFKNSLTASGANSYLARLIYLLRWQINISKDPNDESFIKCIEILNNTRQSICDQIDYAQKKNEIFARKEFTYIVEKMILPRCNQLMLISTNWDTVIDNAIKKIPGINQIFGEALIAHIHGSYLDSKTLYLPTELTQEFYRTNEEEQYIGKYHASLIRELEKAQIVIIYGLSISPMDAELSQILGAGFYNSTLEKIEIIDPQHEYIAERVNLLLNYPTKVLVHGYNPNDLNTKFDYSL